MCVCGNVLECSFFQLCACGECSLMSLLFLVGGPTLCTITTIVYLQGLLHYNTRRKYLPKEPLTNFRANLEEISGPGYKTL